jgi:hypothetical protein
MYSAIPLTLHLLEFGIEIDAATALWSIVRVEPLLGGSGYVGSPTLSPDRTLSAPCADNTTGADDYSVVLRAERSEGATEATIRVNCWSRALFLQRWDTYTQNVTLCTLVCTTIPQQIATIKIVRAELQPDPYGNTFWNVYPLDGSPGFAYSWLRYVRPGDNNRIVTAYRDFRGPDTYENAMREAYVAGNGSGGYGPGFYDYAMECYGAGFAFFGGACDQPTAVYCSVSENRDECHRYFLGTRNDLYYVHSSGRNAHSFYVFLNGQFYFRTSLE